MNYQDIITIDPGKRGGRPCIRGMRIAVADVLSWLAAGMTHEQISATTRNSPKLIFALVLLTRLTVNADS